MLLQNGTRQKWYAVRGETRSTIFLDHPFSFFFFPSQKQSQNLPSPSVFHCPSPMQHSRSSSFSSPFLLSCAFHTATDVPSSANWKSPSSLSPSGVAQSFPLRGADLFCRDEILISVMAWNNHITPFQEWGRTYFTIIRCLFFIFSISSWFVSQRIRSLFSMTSKIQYALFPRIFDPKESQQLTTGILPTKTNTGIGSVHALFRYFSFWSLLVSNFKFLASHASKGPSNFFLLGRM